MKRVDPYYQHIVDLEQRMSCYCTNRASSYTDFCTFGNGSNDSDETEPSTIIDHVSGDILCQNCGCVFESRIMTNGKEWGNYESDRHSGINKSRVGNVTSNPQESLGSRIPSSRFDFVTVTKSNGARIRKKLSTLQLYINKTSREQCIDRVIQRLELLRVHHQLNERILNKAKVIFCELAFNNNYIFRGKMREALLCNCIYYACKEISGSHAFKHEIKQIMNVSDKNFNKAEKVYHSLVTNVSSSMTQLGDDSIRTLFAKQITSLGLKYSDYVPKCSALYTEMAEHSDTFHNITLKSRVAGIIYYYVVLNNNDDDKTSVKSILTVCQLTKPTLMNAYKIIRETCE